MTDEQYDELVHALYDVTLSEQGWAKPLVELAAALDAGNSHLMVWDFQRPAPLFSMTWGMDDRMEAEYCVHYGAIDPRRLAVSSMAEGDWYACHHRFDKRSVERSEFYQDYLIKGGWRYLLGTRLKRHQSLDVFFGLHRAPRQQPFSEENIALMRRLTPHFQRAAQLWLSTEDLRQTALLGTAALDAIEYGVVAIEATSKPVFANRLAGALLREGRPLQLAGGMLTAAGHADAKRLAAAIQECKTTGRAVSLQVGEAASGAGSCVLTVIALREDSPMKRLFRTAALLVLAASDRRRRTLTAQQLIQIFGLTPAEARLARAIAAGESLESYSSNVEISLTTTKSQLQATLKKTGTRRQIDLVRRLTSIPSARQRRG